MPCSNCGIIGHNKLTCGRYNNTMPKSSSYYKDYKQVVNKNYSYAGTNVCVSKLILVTLGMT